LSGTVEFTIGAQVSCQDGRCGGLQRVVFDPIRHAITYLVVEPKHRKNLGHLVPIDLVETTSAEEVRLRCTLAQFEGLDDAEESEFLPGPSGEPGYEQDQVLSMPFFALGGTGLGVVGMGDQDAGPEVVTYDKVPAGDVELRRGQRVHASDGPIGRVRGLVVDPSDHQLTHVLLEEGHLWGKKEVSVPISSVASVDDSVRLRLSKSEVGDLPPLDNEHRT
jgi:sporulation protein YlmC with PRC-barrel domain